MENTSKQYDLVGTSPASFTKTFYIKGITPNELFEGRGSEALNIEQLNHEFSKCCEDFNKALVGNVPSYAVEFCSKIIYEVGPESRSVKKGNSNKIWRFMFKNLNGNVFSVFVSTYKNGNATPSVVNNRLMLTVKQAELLALQTMCEVTDFALRRDNPIILLTPLAGAVFSKESINLLFKTFEEKLPKAEILKVINCSCQSGGHYLKYGNASVAAVALITFTANIQNPVTQASIVQKMLTQYALKGEPVKKSLFKGFCRHATGVVPFESTWTQLKTKATATRNEMIEALEVDNAKLVTIEVVCPSSVSPSTNVERRSVKGLQHKLNKLC